MVMIMDYEKKYKEALGWMQGMYGGLHGKTKEEAEKYFPELKESEDEKVKRIIHSISNKISFHLHDIFTEEEFQCFDAWSNAWLKKQDKPKWTDEDEAHLHSITTHLEQWIERHPNTCGADIQSENLAWLKSLKQRMEEQQ